MNDSANRPAVGVATIVVKEGKILIGEDTKKGVAVYGVPGGHWKNKETLKQCAQREVKEESGIECLSPRLISVYDFYREDKGKSYVTIGMKADYLRGELSENLQEGRLQWAWYSPVAALELNLFPADRVLIQRHLSGIIFE